MRLLTDLTAPLRKNQTRARNDGGFGLVEVILATALFAGMVASIATLIAGGFRSLSQGGELTQAYALAQEAVESVRSIRDDAWNEIIFNQSGIETVGNQWIFKGEGTTDTIGKYTRTLTFNDICRDNSYNVVTCPGSFTDVNTKELSISISWDNFAGLPTSFDSSVYLTNWESRLWIEDTTTDFNDGVFTNTEVSTVLGDGDGAVTLQPN
ncbi:hypothetical protein KC614_01250 [candidate division WWE3 bacterium]|uniref:Prepilin-type N-terminal cleavage/methylation domain-containing protein n=1 Tax=candidate division WWE3 bacterium TaxID=2053526 RepID=A0A955LKE5_UNCKA|nr:hypothetical protein [candidate division WWE3 bacterium]